MFGPNFTHLLHAPIYAGLQIFIQLFMIITKLCHINPPIASRGVKYPPAVSQVLCQLETRFQRFSFTNFSVITRQPCLILPALPNSRWRTETGSSYKLVTGRDVNVMSAATTQFSGISDPLPQVPTSSDFGEQRQVQIGNRNSTQTGSTNILTTETDIDAISVAISTL